jgi:hypothetical protein
MIITISASGSRVGNGLISWTVMVGTELAGGSPGIPPTGPDVAIAPCGAGAATGVAGNAGKGDGAVFDAGFDAGADAEVGAGATAIAVGDGLAAAAAGTAAIWGAGAVTADATAGFTCPAAAAPPVAFDAAGIAAAAGRGAAAAAGPAGRGLAPVALLPFGLAALWPEPNSHPNRPAMPNALA